MDARLSCTEVLEGQTCEEKKETSQLDLLGAEVDQIWST
jgi:hypothetical protein